MCKDPTTVGGTIFKVKEPEISENEETELNTNKHKPLFALVDVI